MFFVYFEEWKQENIKGNPSSNHNPDGLQLAVLSRHHLAVAVNLHSQPVEGFKCTIEVFCFADFIIKVAGPSFDGTHRSLSFNIQFDVEVPVAGATINC